MYRPPLNPAFGTIGIYGNSISIYTGNIEKSDYPFLYSGWVDLCTFDMINSLPVDEIFQDSSAYTLKYGRYARFSSGSTNITIEISENYINDRYRITIFTGSIEGRIPTWKNEITWLDGYPEIDKSKHYEFTLRAGNHKIYGHIIGV